MYKGIKDERWFARLFWESLGDFMSLKGKQKLITKNPHPVDEGDIVQTPDHHVMALTHDVALPMVTLNANQFFWPSSWVVMDSRRVQVAEKDV